MGTQIPGTTSASDSSKIVFIRASKGKLYYKSDENDPDAVMETYEDQRTKETKTIFKHYLWNIRGKIINPDILLNEHINAKELRIELYTGTDTILRLTTKPGTFTADFLINQLINMDPSREVIISTSTDDSGKFTTFWVKYPTGGEKDEWVGLKYSKKNGNDHEVPGVTIKKDEDTGHETKDWTARHAFYSKLFRESFKPMVAKLNGNLMSTDANVNAEGVKSNMQQEVQPTTTQQTPPTPPQVDPIEDMGDDLPF